MQLGLPDGVEQHRQEVLDNYVSMIKPSFISPKNGANVSGVVNVMFNVSDIYLNAVILVINNTLVADGPWSWTKNRLVEANCSYNWDTAQISAGTYELRVLVRRTWQHQRAGTGCGHGKCCGYATCNYSRFQQ
jgi:Bacterial Ig domain